MDERDELEGNVCRLEMIKVGYLAGGVCSLAFFNLSKSAVHKGNGSVLLRYYLGTFIMSPETGHPKSIYLAV